jgi:hypothetical protein
MAHLAKRLGRGFEADVFLTVAVTVDTDRDGLQSELSRLKHDRTIRERFKGTLDAVLASESEFKDSTGN